MQNHSDESLILSIHVGITVSVCVCVCCVHITVLTREAGKVSKEGQGRQIKEEGVTNQVGSAS